MSLRLAPVSRLLVSRLLVSPLLLCPLLLLISPAPGGTAELAAIGSASPCPMTAGQTAVDAACEAPAGASRRRATLVAAPGKASFNLPDGRVAKVDDLMLYNGKFIPEVWRLNAGDVLDIKLQNELKPGDLAATNLHTHGLLVSPDLDTKPDPANPAEVIAAEPVGDTVYVCTLPANQPIGSEGEKHCTQHGDPADTAHARLFFGARRNEMNYQIALPSDHPEGLFWYHPHVHGNARAQVGAGLSGLIFVKGRPAVAGGGVGASGGARPQDASKPVASIERFMMLKDIQVAIDDATAPSIEAHVLPAADRRSDLCGQPAPDTVTPMGMCLSPDNKQGWLFTVNGQVFPRVAVAAREQQIWRIANSSADITYDLALVETRTGRPLRVQILARDGVAAIAEGGSAGTTDAPVMAERVLLMPGSRIEIGVDRATAEGSFDQTRPLLARLRSYGFFTGGAVNFGDAWPAVDLAEVSFAPEVAPAAVASAIEPAVKRTALAPPPRKFQPFVVTAWQPGDKLARAVAPDRMPGSAAAAAPRAQSAMHMHGAPADEHPQPSAPNDPCRNMAGNKDRIIVLTIHKDSKTEDFKIGAGCGKFHGADWQARIEAAKASAAAFGKHSVVLSARAGDTETWTIVNDTDPRESNNELHNFHVHQMKFTVLDVYDPTGRIAPPRGGPYRKVDSYPVPSGGYLRIRIDYTRQMTGGRFVFHCHILEHEDKGMMAEVEVN